MIVVTGSKGFIGSYFVKHLNNVYEIDVENKDVIFEKNFPWYDVELVIHNGAISDTTENDWRKLYEYNFKYTFDLIKQCQDYFVPLKYASSASVYGNSKKYELFPMNFYATSKTAIDVLVDANKFKDVQGFRYYNVYGNGESHKGNQASPITQFTKQARETGKIKVFEGSENYIRDFVCVEDVFNIVMNCDKDGIFDVGTSNPISFLEVAKLVSEKETAKIEEIPFPEYLKDKYQFYTKAKKEFEYEFISVKDWIEDNIIS